MRSFFQASGFVRGPSDDGGPGSGSGSGPDYWDAQGDALRKAKSTHQRWKNKRRSYDAKATANRTWKRETFSLPREQAQLKAKEFLVKYPKAAYWSEVESWRELPGNVIEFTMRRLPSAD